MDDVVADWCSTMGDGVVRGRRHPCLADRKHIYRVLGDEAVQQPKIYCTRSLVNMLVIFLLLIWIRIIHRDRNNVYLVPELGDGDISIRIRCMRLPSVIYAYQFHSPTYIEAIGTAKFWPLLYVKWPSFQITHLPQFLRWQNTELRKYSTANHFMS